MVQVEMGMKMYEMWDGSEEPVWALTGRFEWVNTRSYAYNHCNDTGECLFLKMAWKRTNIWSRAGYRTKELWLSNKAYVVRTLKGTLDD
jgi:hypothetical protein